MTTTSQQYLNSFINHEIHLGQVRNTVFKLKRVHLLLKELGDPQKGLKVIHVAGSKGKGSVCALMASILENAGYKVGLYTSPHINHYRERIRVLTPTGSLRERSGDIFPDCISEEELCAMIDETKDAVKKVQSQSDLGPPSFFEVYTCLALYYFHKRQVHFVVLETGLGGRLDATNAAQSIVAVITPISLEHTRILGNTVEKIAGEKAAIIKKGTRKVVIAPQDANILPVLGQRCRDFHIKPFQVGNDVKCEAGTCNIDGQTFSLKTAKAQYKNIYLPLLGKHQRDNAATSICVVECLQDLGFDIPVRAVMTGCKNVFWPGRLEVAGRNPFILLDGAHNAVSARTLVQTMREILDDKEIILVFGVSKDKDKDAILSELRKITYKIIYAKADHPRASDLEGAVDVKTALNLAQREAGQDEMILITGSIFVVSEARKYLLEREAVCIK